jgi:hypothetical protein
MPDTLQGTMTGQALAPGAAPAAAPNDNSEIDALFANLEKSLKPSMTPEQIQQMFQPAMDQAQGAQAPAPMPVPPKPGIAKTFGATLGAGLASGFTRNPAYLQGTMGELQHQGDESTKVEEGNYLRKAAFDEKKQGNILSMQYKMLEMKAEEQIRMGDRDGALKTLAAQTKLAEALREKHMGQDLEQQKKLSGIKLEGELTKIGARGAQARETVAAKDKAVTGGFNKMELSEYNQRATALRASAEKQITDLATMNGGIGLSTQEGQAQATSIETALDQRLSAIADEIRARTHRTPMSAGVSDTTATGDIIDENVLNAPATEDPIRAAHAKLKATKK